MSARSLSVPRFWLAGLIGLTLVLMGSLPMSAQSVESDAITDKLSQKVRLRLGKTTLARAVAALSEQTGLKIEPEPYLLDRVMVLQMDGASARSVLNALSELNDWRWRETFEHTIFIARHTLKLVAIPAAVPRMVQSAIPKDTRDFLGIPTPSENLNILNTAIANGDKYVTMPIEQAARFAEDSSAALIAGLPPNSRERAPISFDKLTEKQKHDLTAYFVFRTFGFLGYELLSEYHSYVYDPGTAYIELFGTSFRIGLHPMPGMWTGFTWEVTP